MTLSAALAARFATIALGHLGREYPNKLDHVIDGPEDLASPRALHPIFYGSYDWHSCVHGYWLVTHVARRFPDLPEAAAVNALLDLQLTEANVAGELAYLKRPSSRGFERPYGWAWLLALAHEQALVEGEDGQRRARLLAPLASAFADRFLDWLPRATYPIRTGTHFNTAFAFALALGWADALEHDALARALRDKAKAWYANDRDCPAWEPGGDDFLSPALVEAECMRRVLPPDDFGRWLDAFLPRLDRGEPATLFTPATVSDRSDGKIAHLDGVNLSRAWCFRLLAEAVDEGRRPLLREAAERHLAASLPHVAGDYMGEHWLATYAALALG